VVTLADLASLGITPSDSSPPTMSVHARVLKDTLTGVPSTAVGGGGGQGTLQIWVALRYGGSLTTSGTSASTDRVWLGVSTNSNASYLSPGLASGTVSVVDDGVGIRYTRNGIPVAATITGAPLVGAILMLWSCGPTGGGTISYDVDQLAAVAGATIDPLGTYLNGAEDIPKYPVSLADLASDVTAVLPAISSGVMIAANAGTYYVAGPAGPYRDSSARATQRLPADRLLVCASGDHCR